MKAIEVCNEIVATRGAMLVRPRKGTKDEYDAKPYFTGGKRGWVLVDLFSASAVKAVYDALNETNKAKYVTMDLVSMVKMAFKLVK